MKSVKPSQIKGMVDAPGSKSMLQRAIAISLLCSGRTVIYNPTYCDDVKYAVRIARLLGAKILCKKNKISITPPLHRDGTKELKLNCGEAGLCLRLFTPVAALFSEQNQILLTGKGTLLRRPVDMMKNTLTQLGVAFSSNKGLLPVSVQGTLQGGKADVDGSVSSQFLTGLLIALPCAADDSILLVHDLKSRPYIDMTISLMKHFGVSVKRSSGDKFHIKGQQQYAPAVYHAEGDWSGAAFLLVAGAIAGEIAVGNLYYSSTQGDMEILTALKKAGADVSVDKEKRITRTRKKRLNAFEFDASDCPDLFPPLAALASACRGTSIITGVERLKFKESDRAQTIADQFTKMGISINICGNAMEIKGGKVKGALVDSCNDHRIAMACAVAALAGDGEVKIENEEAVNKSYPEFFHDLASVMISAQK